MGRKESNQTNKTNADAQTGLHLCSHATKSVFSRRGPYNQGITLFKNITGIGLSLDIGSEILLCDNTSVKP